MISAPEEFIMTHLMQQLTNFLITPMALALSSPSQASFHNLSLSIDPCGMSLPLRWILSVMLVWDRTGEEWSFRRRVAWKMGGSKFTRPHWAGGRRWLQCPSHGHVNTRKAPVKDCSMISMGWREGIGKSLGQNARRIWFGSQWVYPELRHLSVLPNVLGGIYDRR